jgi:flagellar biosynthesis/type III secretory pathway M-ring protein FliF/YscJ
MFRKRRPSVEARPKEIPAPSSSSSAAGSGSGALPAADSGGKHIQEHEQRLAQLEAETLSRIQLPTKTRKSEVLVKHIRESVTKDPGSATNVLRSWISDTEVRRN